jgi:hypothetical protein
VSKTKPNVRRKTADNGSRSLLWQEAAGPDGQAYRPSNSRLTKEDTLVGQCSSHDFGSVIHHRPGGFGQGIGQNVGDPNDAAALLMRKHLCGGVMVSETALDNAVRDAPRRVVATDQPLARLEAVKEVSIRSSPSRFAAVRKPGATRS